MATPSPLHDRHAILGAHFGERHEREVVLDYGDRDGEFAALTTSVGIEDRSGRALIGLTGSDRVAFLHGQTTNEVNKLPAGSANAAVLLTNRGKMLSEVVVLKREEALWVGGEVGYGPELLSALQRNCISEEVEFEDLSLRFGQIGLFGPRAASALARLAGGPIDMTEWVHRELTLHGAAATVLATSTIGVPSFELFIELSGLAAVWDALRAQGARPFGEVAFDLQRIAAGVPRYGVDMTEDTNPLEANLERAISYQKGCYVGQEVIAKATFRGHVTRKLTGLDFGSIPAPAPGELQLEGRVVGRVTSSARLPDGRTVGLGYVKRDLAKPGVHLTLADGTAASTCALPLGAAPSP